MVTRLIVIGSGPIGIAAAVEANARGYETTVLERAEPGDALLKWGSTRFFSPFSMNINPRMRDLLRKSPDDDAILTGREFVDDVLRPLAATLNVKTQHRVVAIGRRGLTREEYAGHPLRSERPFRLLVDTPDGEQTFDSEIVLDATGGYRLPRPFGVPGERAARLIRTLGELERADLERRRVLLVGNGHSAANAIAVLARSGAEVTWAVRTPNRRPCEEVANDPLPERQRVVAMANALAESPPAWLTVERRAMVERIDGDTVLLTGGRAVTVDVIAAFTGYRPDSSYLGELALEISAVTEGGARLQRAIANVTDCLNVPAVRRQDLESGEPNFFFIGSRAYGRARTFLLHTGLKQLDSIFEGLPR